MLSFFGRNLYLSEKVNLDSWMGGGMRMFAEIDKSLNRVVFLEVNEQNGTKAYFNLNKFKKIEDQVMSMRILPTAEKSLVLRKEVFTDQQLKQNLGVNLDSTVSLRIIVNKVIYLPQTKKLQFMEIYSDENKN